jgi:flagellar protein FlaG
MGIDRISSPSITSMQTSNVRENRQEQPQRNLEEKQYQSQQQPEQKVSKDFLEKTVQGLNEFLLPSTTSLKFQLHDQSEEYYVQVIDDKTKEVIRQIPSKEFLDMYASMKDILGLVVDNKI